MYDRVCLKVYSLCQLIWGQYDDASGVQRSLYGFVFPGDINDRRPRGYEAQP